MECLCNFQPGSGLALHHDCIRRGLLDGIGRVGTGVGDSCKRQRRYEILAVKNNVAMAIGLVLEQLDLFHATAPTREFHADVCVAQRDRLLGRSRFFGFGYGGFLRWRCRGGLGRRLGSLRYGRSGIGNDRWRGVRGLSVSADKSCSPRPGKQTGR